MHIFNEDIETHVLINGQTNRASYILSISKDDYA